jgi:acyl-CoA thioesterase FadM
MGSNGEPIRYVTASLKVDFRRPTPMGTELTIKGKLRSMEGRKVWVDLTLCAGGEVCATAEMLAIRFKQ